jgi:hypothetical protein
MITLTSPETNKTIELEPHSEAYIKWSATQVHKRYLSKATPEELAKHGANTQRHIDNLYAIFLNQLSWEQREVWTGITEAMDTYELKVKGEFVTFTLEVIGKEFHVIVKDLLERPAVKSVKVKKL